MQGGGFFGKGKVQVAYNGDTVLLRVRHVSTQTRRLKGLIAEFCRREVAVKRPYYGPFEVRIWTSKLPDMRGAHDVDNVAKACLDALNGVFWRDDRQVVRLISERFTGDANEIAIRVRPLDSELEPVPMDETLFNL
ncbi:RusA family crossover junction endodeoxyribonuclease [Aquisalinus flavus]|uniref:Uncharacterized protein n=1 Tax=Aquisalinus flavus TaxID=1526572 RepID=A0A8J2Y6C7_9PROT|nr:RusA family crossover junction endodeoxyribonuclease [Aquisalinus flavus]GGD01273.1 hypothetical protein GCM10011342_07860 [Aquisalinus flavus]